MIYLYCFTVTSQSTKILTNKPDEGNDITLFCDEPNIEQGFKVYYKP